MSLTLAAFSPDWTPKGSVNLSKAKAKTFFDHLSETGNFHFTIGLEDSALGSLDYDDKIVCLVDGTARFGGVIDTINESPVDAGEEAGQVAVIGGKGNARILDWANVHPEYGAGRRTPDMRPMDYTSGSFDDTSWPNAVEVQIANAPSGPWPNSPEGWPDPDARWIWVQALVGGAAPNGDGWFRGVFSLAISGRYALFATADDGFEVHVDGTRLLGEQTGSMWNTPRRVDLDLDAGTHVWGIHGRNVGGGPAGVILTVLEATNGGRDLGAVVARTSSAWHCIGYTPDPPGMTPGHIVRVFRDEAVARGMWVNDGGLVLAFDDFEDSNGDPWSATINPTFSVGASYLDVMRQIAEFGFDWHMDATSNTLRMYNEEGLGGEDSTVLARAANLLSLTRMGSSETRTNVLLSRYRGGGTDQQGWTVINDPGGSQAVRRREGFLSAGQQDASYINQLAAATLAALSAPTEAITAEPLERPDASGSEHCRAYVDYGLGGWIHAPNRADVSTRYRVRGITVTQEDKDSLVVAIPELSTIRMEWEQRLQRIIRRMIPGTLEGGSESASLPPPPASFDLPVDIPPDLGDLVVPYDFPDGPLGIENGEIVPFDDFGGGDFGGGMPQFSIPGPLGVTRTVGHTTSGGDASEVLAHLSVAGTTATTFDVILRGSPNVAIGTFTIPANVLEPPSFSWAHTFNSGDHIWVSCVIPGSGAHGLGVQIS